MVKNAPGGILIVHKSEGMTSHDVVNKVRRLFDTKQVGHTGTLDPMASGVLPVLVGRAVKASQYVSAEEKIYRAELRLGLETDTEDCTGKVLRTDSFRPDETAVREACASMLGSQMQIPPMYSAIKMNGEKLYDLARRGIEVQREARPIVISSLEPERVAEDLYTLTVRCSKGTYIRTICSDLGRKLGCGGIMNRLCRLQSGPFCLENALDLSQLESLSPEERLGKLLPVDRFFEDCPSLSFPPFYETLFRNGCEIYLEKIRASFPIGTRLRIYHDAVFVALAEVREYESGPAVKALTFFDVDGGKQ